MQSPVDGESGKGHSSRNEDPPPSRTLSQPWFRALRFRRVRVHLDAQFARREERAGRRRSAGRESAGLAGLFGAALIEPIRRGDRDDGEKPVADDVHWDDDEANGSVLSWKRPPLPLVAGTGKSVFPEIREKNERSLNRGPVCPSSPPHEDWIPPLPSETSSHRPIAMDPSLQVIDAFLRNFSPEVEGRSVATLTADLKEKLVQLRLGKLDAPGRREISRVLLANPAAMAFLVSEVQTHGTGGVQAV